MQDLLLVPVVAAAFVFGWYLMKKLDAFLEKSRQTQDSFLSTGQDILRIGFSNPLVADSLSDALEKYSKIQPNVSVNLFSGTEDGLIKDLSAQKLDVIFLTENVENLLKAHYDSKKILLNCTPVFMKYSGSPIEPVTEGTIWQNVLYARTPNTLYVHCFIECLQGGMIGQKVQSPNLIK